MERAQCFHCRICWDDTPERLLAQRQEFGEKILCPGCRDAISTGVLKKEDVGHKDAWRWEGYLDVPHKSKGPKCHICAHDDGKHDNACWKEQTQVLYKAMKHLLHATGFATRFTQEGWDALYEPKQRATVAIDLVKGRHLDIRVEERR